MTPNDPPPLTNGHSDLVRSSVDALLIYNHATNGTVNKINPALTSLACPISSLHLDKNNARKHAKRDLDTIAASLDLHGQQKPIVVLRNGKVIAGNGTLLAAKQLGWDDIAAVTYNDEDEAKAAAYAIVDNRSAELSEWDFEALAASLKSLPDDLLANVGFEQFELDPLLQSSWSPADVDGSEPNVNDDEASTHSVSFTEEQWRFVLGAIAAAANQHGRPVLPSEALVMLCAAELGIEPPAPMTPWVGLDFKADGVRLARASDVDVLYANAKQVSKDLGGMFWMKVALEAAVEAGDVIIHEPTSSFSHCHLRRDGVTVVHEIWTARDARGTGIGKLMFGKVRRPIELKCPVDLPSNGFYEKVCTLDRVETNKRGRGLNVWRLE